MKPELSYKTVLKGSSLFCSFSCGAIGILFFLMAISGLPISINGKETIMTAYQSLIFLCLPLLGAIVGCIWSPFIYLCLNYGIIPLLKVWDMDWIIVHKPK